MLEWVSLNRSYSPETVAAMTSAFDRVCRSLSAGAGASDDTRQRLALIILNHADRGERDPRRLSELAFQELMGLAQGLRAPSPKRACR